MPTSNWWETISDHELEEILDTFDRIQMDDWWDLTPEEEQMAIAAADEAARRYMEIRGSQTSTRTRVRYEELARPDRGRPKKKGRHGIYSDLYSRRHD